MSPGRRALWATVFLAGCRPALDRAAPAPRPAPTVHQDSSSQSAPSPDPEDSEGGPTPAVALNGGTSRPVPLDRVASGGATVGGSAPCPFAALRREERRLPSEERGVELLTLRVRAFGPRRGVVVLAHGAGSGGSASWDLRGASLMRHLACAGFDAYAFDARGFGGSTRPPALAGPEAGEPVVRMQEVLADLGAVVRFAAASSSVAAVDLVGWSWGAEVAGRFTAERGGAIRRLALLAPIYDRRWPQRHVQDRVWYSERREALDAAFPAAREERPIWDDFVASLFRFEPGGVLRLPAGPYRDLYGEDAPLWDPARIQVPVLLMRGADDRASEEGPFLRLFAALKGAPEREAVQLAGLAHFLWRERGRERAIGRLVTFLEAADLTRSGS